MNIRNVLLRNIYKILAHYGEERQVLKAIEELIELQQAIIHDDRENIKEEIADVYLMLEQVKKMYHFTDTEIIEVVENKVNRQLKRMEKERKCDNG